MYTLGINIARQVGGELKGVLSKDELAKVALGFGDSLVGESGDDKELLAKYGPLLNELLSTRSHMVADKAKAEGLEFIKKYLTENPTAINTASGLVYKEVVPGLGKQVCTVMQKPQFASTILLLLIIAPPFPRVL
jgi:hypothetical protein